MEFVCDSTLDRACRILFGLEVSVNHNFLRHLRPPRIKTAFRKKALLIHPDRLAMSDEKTRGKYTALFIETKWAYDHLRNFCKDRDRGRFLFSGRNRIIKKPQQTFKKPYHQSMKPERPKRFHTSWYYTGYMPQRKLLFGEFLFYSQIIPWNEFIKAIIMQRKGRPRFGDIASRWLYLTEAEIEIIVSNKKCLELIGEAARRMDILNQVQVGAVLYYQRFVQKPIGEYLIESGFIKKFRIDTHLQNFLHHNSQFHNQGKF
jgi:hypothetical protein